MPMRRKPGTLLPLELNILHTAMELHAHGTHDFHGYLLASALKEREDAKLLTGHGTLYKALGRLAERGLLASEWEDPAIAATEERPRRRLYRITALGETVLREAEAAVPNANSGWQPA